MQTAQGSCSGHVCAWPRGIIEDNPSVGIPTEPSFLTVESSWLCGGSEEGLGMEAEVEEEEEQEQSEIAGGQEEGF